MAKLKSAQMIGGLGKKELYDHTPKECVLALLDFCDPYQDHIWEPFCGDGNIAETLMSKGYHVLATDPNHNGDYGQRGVLPYDIKITDNYAIISNPPPHETELFIRYALDVLDTPFLALMHKSTYWHAASRFNLYYDTYPSFVLPMTWRPDFSGQGSPTMDFTWTVWRGKQYEREQEGCTYYELLPKPEPNKLHIVSEEVPITQFSMHSLGIFCNGEKL